MGEKEKRSFRVCASLTVPWQSSPAPLRGSAARSQRSLPGKGRLLFWLALRPRRLRRRRPASRVHQGGAPPLGVRSLACRPGPILSTSA